MYAAFEIDGKMPCKKNNWKPAKGRIYLDPEVKDRLAQIRLLIMCEYRKFCFQPMTKAEVSATFYTSVEKADLDGMLTSLLDCMKGQVIVDDSIKHLNKLSCGAVLCSPGSEKFLVITRGLVE